jgi:hypothetical protein
MRKLFLMLAVLLVASAAYAADVTISCEQVGDTNEAIVSYLASKDVNIPRAFALNIQLDNEETIYSVTPEDPCYWVYPGQYPSDPNGPVGNPDDSSDTLPGIDTNGVTIEMASLHSPPGNVSNPNAPGLGGELLSIMVTGSCNMAISGNAARGKVVFYDATNDDDIGRDVVYTGCEIYTGCLAKDDPNWSEWDDLGQPECWCWPRQCHGDADGITEGKELFRVGSYDLGILKDAWQKTAAQLTGNDACADFDHVAEGKELFRVGGFDLGILKANWHKLDGEIPADCQ